MPISRSSSNGAAAGALLAAALCSCTGTFSSTNGTDPESPGLTEPPGQSTPSTPKLLTVRAVQLAPQQYERAVRALVPEAPSIARELDQLLGRESGEQSPLSSPSTLDTSVADALFRHAGTVGEQVAQDPALLGPCLAEELPRGGGELSRCIRGDLRSFLRRAWRRVPTEDEIDGYVSLTLDLHDQGSSWGEATSAVVQAAILSPNFSFRTEHGGDDQSVETTLDAYERASALSFVLLGGPPDERLFDRAEMGELMLAGGMRAAASAILERPEEAHGFLDFIAEYSGTAAAKNSAVLSWDPSLPPEIRADMAEESKHLAAHVLAEDDGRFGTLLAAPYSVITPRLASLYGVDPLGEGWTMTPLPTRERAGVITMAGVLATHADPSTDNTPILRGHFIRKYLLCDPPAAPPDDIPDPPPAGAGETPRERVEAYTGAPGCVGCHRLMNPLGFALDSFDPIGRYRTHQEDRPIDTTGALYWARGDASYFDDARGLAEALGNEPAALDCFVAKFFHYAYGRPAVPGDTPELHRLQEAFRASGGDMRELMLETVSAAHFVDRERRAQ
ncbi:MAG: DUF1588 domain-containing protein [Myxococcota bacterium]